MSDTREDPEPIQTVHYKDNEEITSVDRICTQLTNILSSLSSLSTRWRYLSDIS